MANYYIDGRVTNGVGGSPRRAVVAVFSRTTFLLLGQTQSIVEDGSYYLEFPNHPDPVFVVCFHSDYDTPPEVEPYFALATPPTGEAEIHDNITPVLIDAPPT